MTTFQDGPAKGATLMLTRAPFFLRVTEAGGKFDALDQVEDTPRPEEKLFAYEMVGTPGMVHVNRGRGRGGMYAMASYRLVSLQPAEVEMRDSEAWTDWCTRQAKLRGMLK